MTDHTDSHPREASGDPLLWAPWRAEYFKLVRPLPDFLAEAAAATDDKAHLVVRRAKTAFLILNRYPYAPGHVMAVPYRKVGGMEDLSPDEVSDIWNLAIAAQRALRRAVKAQGFNVGLNLGAAAGAGVADHLHLHVVPRWEGDQNFLPVLGGVRVISEALEDMYDKLVAALES
jgi:ATP adenylyltransferase